MYFLYIWYIDVFFCYGSSIKDKGGWELLSIHSVVHVPLHLAGRLEEKFRVCPPRGAPLKPWFDYAKQVDTFGDSSVPMCCVFM